MTWAITIILVIPLTAISFFYYSVFQNSLLDDAKRKREEDLNSMKAEMEVNLNHMISVINELVYAQEFFYFLDQKNILSKEEISYYVSNVQKQMLDIRYMYPNLYYRITIYSSNTQFSEEGWLKDWQVELAQLLDKDYYNEVKGIQRIESYPYSKIYFGEVRTAKFVLTDLAQEKLRAEVEQMDSLILPAYQKIHSITSKEFIGLIEVDMELSKLIGESYLYSKDDRADYLLFNEEGKFIYGNKLYESYFFEAADLRKEKGTKEITIDNDRYIMTYTQCEMNGMICAVAMSKAEILSTASQMIRNVIIIAVLGTGILMLLIHWLMKKMLKRLLVLDGMMGQIEMGKYDVVIQENKNNDEISRIEQRFNQMATQLRAKRDAELQALQAQINPHFLYNTLENLRMQCEIDGYGAIGNRLSALGNLFRYSIKFGSHEVPFEMEWNNLKNYISIMEMRFDEQLKFIMEKEAGIEKIIVPKMMLQPFVENCFEHGFKNQMPPWNLVIQAYREEGKLFISIEDNGKGMEEKRLEEIRVSMKESKPLESRAHKGTSIGIVNVKQRLDIVGNEGTGVKIESNPGGGTKVLIVIVLKEDEV